MKLATEVSVFVNLVRAAVVLLAVGAVALFGRMSPAIEEILADNVVSLVAVEDMLAVLAQPDLPEEEATSRFLEALEVARDNLTEPEEQPIVVRIESSWEGALGASATDEARVRLLEDVRMLSEINRRSMDAADRAAGRLGKAGAWAVVLLSLLILAITQIFAVRLEERVVQPLSAVEQVVAAAEAGRSQRRCALRGPPEVQRIAAGLNRLLDLTPPLRTSSIDGRPVGYQDQLVEKSSSEPAESVRQET